MPGRLAYAMIGLATFFFVEQSTNSVTLAGIATGAETIASSLTAGFRGHIIDKFGQTIPLSIFVPSWVTAVTVMSQQTHAATIVAASLFVGLASPPINLSTRPLWRYAVGAENLRTAYAIDTTMMNATTVVGPFIATAIAIGSGAMYALVFTAACMAIGGVAMITMPLSRTWKPEHVESATRTLFSHKPFQLLAIEGMIFGLGWGILEIAIPSFATITQNPQLSAPLLGTLAGTSIIGGILIGGRASSITPLRGFRIAQVAVTLCAAPLAFTSPGWSMGIVLALLGLSIGFAQVYHWEVLEAVRPEGTATSAAAWLWTMEGSMLAIGAALGAFLVEHVSAHIALFGVFVGMFSGTAFIWWYATPYLVKADRQLSEVEMVQALVDIEPTRQ